MIERHERRPLTARRHIGRSEVVDDGNADCGGEPRAVTDLQRASLLRPVPYGLSMKADDVDGRWPNTGVREQSRDGFRVQVRKFLDHWPPGGIRFAAEQGTQPIAEVGGVRGGRRRPVLEYPLAIGDQQRSVDAVERGAAHQADGPQWRGQPRFASHLHRGHDRLLLFKHPAHDTWLFSMIDTLKISRRLENANFS